MKVMRFYLISLLLFGTGYIFTPGISAQDGSMFTGVGIELNNHNKANGALGGGVMAGYVINSQFTAGLRIGFFHALNRDLSSFEPNAFFRYNLPWLPGLFAQAEVGSVIYLYDDDVFPAFSGGLSIGWRHNLADSIFIEPAVRFGYPYIWGIGITAGYVLPSRLGAGRAAAPAGGNHD